MAAIHGSYLSCDGITDLTDYFRLFRSGCLPADYWPDATALPLHGQTAVAWLRAWWYRLAMETDNFEVEETAAFTVRLPKEMHTWLRRYCFESGISMASFVNAAVEHEREKIERPARRR